MNHRPVCVKCLVEMRPKTNGVAVLDMASFGPYKVWQGDVWKCPKCGYEIVVGFAEEGVEHYKVGFEELVEAFRGAGKLLECRE